MTTLQVNEKIKLIIDSPTLEHISLNALPNIFNDEYFFISYSHLDYKLVYVDLLELEEEKLNIWYDRGLPAGVNWEDSAEDQILKQKCRGIIFYLSKSTLTSNACLEEVRLTKKYNKNYVIIILPDENKQYMSPVAMINKYVDNEADKELLLSVFGEKNIYLQLDYPIDKKIEKINLLKSNDLLEYSLIGDDAIVERITDSYAKKIAINSLIEKDNKQYPVKQIGASAFANCERLREVNVQKVKSLAVELPKPSIGFSSFYIENKENNLKEYQKRLELYKTGFIIHPFAFLNCDSLESFDFVQIGMNNITLSKRAFSNCTGLKEVSFYPYQEVFLGEECFYGCKALEEVKLPDFDFVTKKNMFSHSNLKSISKLERTYPSTAYYPYKISNSSIVKGKTLFTGSLDTIIGKNISTIGEEAFAGNELITKMILPEKVVHISDGAFMDDVNLTNIEFKAKNLLSIGKKAFSNCGFINVELPEVTEVIEEYSFANSKLESIIINEVKEMGDGVFSGCKNLKTAEIKGTISGLPNATFENCSSLREVMINNITSIGEKAFFSCYSLKEFIVPDGTVKLGNMAFAFSGLERVFLPESLCYLENCAFAYCKNLTEIHIPSQIHFFSNSFIGCSSLKTIYCDCEKEEISFSLALSPLRFDEKRGFLDQENDQFIVHCIDGDIEFTFKKSINNHAINKYLRKEEILHKERYS